jgi:cytosine/adenosine deaminase-related metal-dependent hydrolase
MLTNILLRPADVSGIRHQVNLWWGHGKDRPVFGFRSDHSRSWFEAVTTNAAQVMNLDGYGLAVGCNANLVVLQAADPIDAIRLRARRLAGIRYGKVIAERPEEVGALFVEGRPSHLYPASYALVFA